MCDVPLYRLILFTSIFFTTSLPHMSSSSDTGLGGHATLSAVAAIGNPRYPPSSSKKLILDAQIYLGTTTEQLTGVVSYFNVANLNVGLNDVALYHIECTVSSFLSTS